MPGDVYISPKKNCGDVKHLEENKHQGQRFAVLFSVLCHSQRLSMLCAEVLACQSVFRVIPVMKDCTAQCVV